MKIILTNFPILHYRVGRLEAASGATNRERNIKGTGCKKTLDKSITYYYCNRTRYYNPSTTGKRSLKSQSSSKVNAHCTASIILTHHDSGAVAADISVTHITSTPLHWGIFELVKPQEKKSLRSLLRE